MASLPPEKQTAADNKTEATMGTKIELCFERVLTEEEEDKIYEFLDKEITEDWVGFSTVREFEE